MALSLIFQVFSNVFLQGKKTEKKKFLQWASGLLGFGSKSSELKHDMNSVRIKTNSTSMVSLPISLSRQNPFWQQFSGHGSPHAVLGTLIISLHSQLGHEDR
jgi:hypothetical protein